MAKAVVTNLKEFQGRVADFAKSLPQEHAVLFQKKVVMQALTKIVMRTPVDTGRARGNWQVGVGTPKLGEIDTTDLDGGATISEGASALAGLPPFTTVYITNNVAYIIPLEEGHSNQAPQGMVELTLAELAVMLEK